LASALFLTELTEETLLRRRKLAGFDLESNAPKHPGRIITTVPKAKEVRPLVERCITLARRSAVAAAAAKEFATTADRNSTEWKTWRKSENYKNGARRSSPS